MKSPVYRLFVERKEGFESEARRTLSELTGFVGISSLEAVRYLNRYDIEGIDEATLERAETTVFSEPRGDRVYRETFPAGADETILAIEYLPGQYDQRADSATQCLALLATDGVGSPGGVTVRCARLYALKGPLTDGDIKRARDYLVNPVDSRVAAEGKPETLEMRIHDPSPVPVVTDFVSMDEAALSVYRASAGLAMDDADIRFLQAWFRKEGRDPTETEIRVLDTYWSDHCRHTTFNTILSDIEIEESPYAKTMRDALEAYSGLRLELYGERAKPKDGEAAKKPVTLMDMACIGAKALKKRGLLPDVEESAEINACSIFIDVKTTDDSGKNAGTEKWLLMFKNETHNHPTEIEPFGGAATCIGGAIRDPLSGRAWVYQSLRVTGAGDPTAPIADTIPGKLPQIKLTREAAAGFSAYGNQIGLATGQVVEYYDPGFLAKRMELGAVIAATPVTSVVREEPEAGDVVVMVGGGTGRDGIGGATGSSKAHTEESVNTAGAEVQKGNAVEERKIQRLFRDPAVTRLIRRCNDFGAGGVAVAVGELSPGLDIDLDAVPKKYEGLNGTELAISESQERMAVVVRERDAKAFIAAANAENLNAAVIARVTGDNRLVIRWRGSKIVDIDRAFLDTAGATRAASARIPAPRGRWLWETGKAEATGAERWYSVLGDLRVASQRGLTERFDGSIGSSSLLFPMGGAWQSTPEAGMAARIPVGPGKETTTASLMTMGYDPRAASWSPFHGAQYAVLESLAKILALGGNPETARLTFQEYFERTTSQESWGKPAAALLGALQAQIACGTAAIGGKDSMSGSFRDISVPPTLVSFAVTTVDEKFVRGGSLQGAGHALVLARCPWKADGTPDWEAFLSGARALRALAEKNPARVFAAYPVGIGGVAAAICKMAFGNRVGVRLDETALAAIPIPAPFASVGTAAASRGNLDAPLFAPLHGSLLVEVATEDARDIPAHWSIIGETVAESAILVGALRVPLDQAQLAWEKPLARVFPPVSSELPPTLPEWARSAPKVIEADTSTKSSDRPARAPKSGAKPRVAVPVFPGTNCEYDMARAFALAGADARIVVLRNRTARDLAESIEELSRAIDGSEILALSGGFSAGDEPDGSGKFIANVIREARVTDAIMSLVESRKGLVLGICNGFQALVKVGLVPYGTIVPPSADMPTLTYNTVGRHVSRFARTRISSTVSSWAHGFEAGSVHSVPVSHGEGRLVLDESLARQLFAEGRVFSQYVDSEGRVTMTEPDNPNGSMFAVEGLTDPTGRILGKMGHSERAIDVGPGGSTTSLYKNIPDNTCQNIFAAGVRYFE